MASSPQHNGRRRGSAFSTTSYSSLSSGSPTHGVLYATKTILNPGQDDELECRGFQRSICKTILAHLLSILCLGLPYLVAHWKPEWKIKWYRTACPLFSADAVLVVDPNDKKSAVVQINVIDVGEDFPAEFIHRSSESGQFLDAPSTGVNDSDTDRLVVPNKLTFRYFMHRHAKYVWSSRERVFLRLKGYDEGHPVHKFSTVYSQGLRSDQQSVQQTLYGQNTIDVEVKSYIRLLFEEVLNPFYIFQIASIVLWSLDNYYYYAACIFVISAISCGISLYETRRQSQALHDMVASSNDLKVSVFCIFQNHKNAD